MNKNPPLILSPGQRKLLDSLRPILQLATCGIRSKLPLTPRTSTLIAGESGTGKSHVVRMLAHEAKVPFWETNVSSWLVLGSRTENPTLAALVKWILEKDRGVIFLDELDKLTALGEWTSAIRLEIHDLIDGRIPHGAIRIPEDKVRAEFADQLDHSSCVSLIEFDVQQKIRNNFLIVGAGAWQQGWQDRRNPIGFRRDDPKPAGIGRLEILKSVAPEILQRFRNEVLYLNPMTPTDYFIVLEAQTQHLPEKHRIRFVELATQAIPEAVENGLGMRMFEEIYTRLCSEVIFNCAGDEFVFRDVLLNR